VSDLPALTELARTLMETVRSTAVDYAEAVSDSASPFASNPAGLRRANRETYAAFTAACDAVEAQLAALVALATGGAADTARLDWLDTRREAIEDVRTVGRQVGDDEWVPEQERELLGYHWDGIEGQCDAIREAIDAERSLTVERPADAD
jgi:hypothetical protein